MVQLCIKNSQVLFIKRASFWLQFFSLNRDPLVRILSSTLLFCLNLFSWNHFNSPEVNPHNGLLGQICSNQRKPLSVLRRAICHEHNGLGLSRRKGHLERVRRYRNSPAVGQISTGPNWKVINSLHLNPVVLALIYVSNESCLLSRFLPLLTANTKAKSLDF